MQIAPEVAEALAGGRPVVALESTLISHGLPRPRNLDVAHQVEDAVRAEGALPATIAVVGGAARIGLDEEALEVIAAGEEVVKCGVRDLAPLAARGGHGATTVAATAHLAVRAGIRLFATGGLGGVHRGARESWDVSADLDTLARTGIVVVCSGVKSILDVGATLERLETLNVTVLGYATDEFPGFYLADSGHPAPWRVDSPEEVAAVVRARDERRRGRARDRGGESAAAGRAAGPRATRPRARRRAGASRARGSGRQGRHAVPARPVPQRDRRGEPRGERATRAPQRGARRARGGRSRRPMTRVVVLGDVMVDVVTRLSGPVAPGSDSPARIAFEGGGQAANTAAWLAVAGARVALVARVGDDSAGRMAVAELEALGVDTRVAVDGERPTGTCVVVVAADGERTMFPDAGANDGLATGDLADDLLVRGDHLHVAGYALLRNGSRAAALSAIERAGAAGMSVSVDPSSAALLSGGLPRLGKGVGLLLPNALEAAALTGREDPVAAARALAESFPEVVVTLGQQGALWTDGDQVIRVAAAAADVVDTTGAGDAFAAGLLAARLHGAGPAEALRAGCSLAARAVAAAGARPEHC